MGALARLAGAVCALYGAYMAMSGDLVWGVIYAIAGIIVYVLGGGER